STHTFTGPTVSDGLCLGYGTSGSGTYSFRTGASLTVANNEYVGYSGTGVYTQTGGSNVINAGIPFKSNLYFGYTNGASGTGTLSGGTLSVNYLEVIGNAGLGTFTQTGGYNSAAYVMLG